MANSISISTSSRVSARRQIAVQIAARILSGELGAGRRLPSGRAIARRLGVNRCVVAGAYRQLTCWGLVRTAVGSGAFVAGGEPSNAATAGSLRRFLEARRASGSPLSDTAELLQQWARAARRRSVTVVEREPALRSILVEELRAGLGAIRVGQASIPDIVRNPGVVSTALVVARRGLVDPLQTVLPPWVEALPVRFRMPHAELLAGAPSRAGGVVALCTRSRCLADFARDLIAATHGDRVGLLHVDPSDAAAVRRARRLGRGLFSDTVCAPMLMRTLRGEGAGRARVRVVHLVAARFILELSRYLRAPEQSGT